MHLSISFSSHIYLCIWPIGNKHHLRGINKEHISVGKHFGNVLCSVTIARRLDIRCWKHTILSCLPSNGVDDNAEQSRCLCMLNHNSSPCTVQSGDFNFVTIYEEKLIFLRDESCLHWRNLTWICIISNALVIIMLELFLHLFRYPEFLHRK